ncbi:MAG TPA: 2-aminoethylphosphonate--pyruvate transaminase [Verrucomicrobiales bacterium]|nr:2-aminoethylphosphonate--pyruvate transaminase [Verrucomicrobiales bacterium]
MNKSSSIPLLPLARDPLLFTPGPLTTSMSVKQAMLHDAGSWHWEFNEKVKRVRERLLSIAELSRESGWECVLMQGTGTFGVEAVFQTCIPPQGKVAVLSNGAYGERIILMLQHAGIDHVALRTPEDQPNDPAALDALIARDPAITHVAVVHCETTTGILNPIANIGAVARRHGLTYIVDAMSSFGAYPIDLVGHGVDFLISSANKCIEGVPGFSFVLCRRAKLMEAEGWARSLSLNLVDQLKGFEKNGQFRYTPPTHSILAFEQALDELDLEGGVAGRATRYRRNHEVLLAGMTKLGFRSLLPAGVQSHIITSFIYPTDPKFVWLDFYARVANKGFILYPGKISQADTFRIGNIGRLFESDMRAVVYAIGEAIEEMGVKLT